MNREGSIDKLVFALAFIALAVLLFSFYQIYDLKNDLKSRTGRQYAAAQPVRQSETAELSGDTSIIPRGIPEIYGKELGVSYDDISSADPKKADLAIKKLGTLDEQTTLKGKDLERYTAIVGKISCEYCCGVDSIIFKNGNPACGCAHSFAMRGLAKYLIKNHDNEYSDDEVLEELGKWKTLFFPAQMSKKAAILKGKGIDLNYINLASNKYRGIENGD